MDGHARRPSNHRSFRRECQCHILERSVNSYRLLANEIAEYFSLGDFPEISKRARIASEPIILASRRLFNHTLTTSCGIRIVHRDGWGQRMLHFSDRVAQATLLHASRSGLWRSRQVQIGSLALNWRAARAGCAPVARVFPPTSVVAAFLRSSVDCASNW